MAAPTIVNGGNSISDASSADASKDASHRPTIEDVVDEEDIAHPPPSAHLPVQNANDNATSGAEPVLSEEAAGKKHAVDEPAADAPKPAPKLDVTSEEAFPPL